jgi:hypothetical protein
MALADGDFINGNLPELVQLGLAETPLEVFGLDVLDGVPTDLEVLGHVLDGHVPGQIQGVALEGAGVAFLGIGEADLDLTHAVTDRTPDPGHVQGYESGFGTDRHGAECAFLMAANPDVLAAALRTAEPLTRLFDAEGHFPSVELLASILVANDTEGVIQ